MEKLQVGIVFGNKSVEYEVFLQSAKNIIDAIDKSRFDVALLGVDKQGQRHISDASNYLLGADGLAHIALCPLTINLAQVPGRHEYQLIDAQNGQLLSTVDVILPIVHGTLGEDDSLQGMLQVANLPFAGPDILVLAACMDKDVTRRLLRDARLNIAPFIIPMRANRHDIDFAEVKSKLGLPLSVKPVNQGFSTDVSKVASEKQYIITINLAFEFNHKVIVEQGIGGHEIKCAVLGNGNPQASTCGKIVFTSDSYVYDIKYIDEDGVKVAVPAAIAPRVNDEIRAVAVQAYQTLGCANMTRVDVFLTPEDEVVINEINILPGLANINTYPKLWQVSGPGYINLITRLIGLALERHVADNTLKTTM